MSSKPLSILYVSSEVYPYAKTGGLADVSYAMPLAMRELNHDIRVMLPKYGNISERKNRIHEINRLRDIPIPVGDITEPATVKSSSVNNPRQKVQAYVTTNYNYFDALKGLYNDPVTGKAYNNDERFIFFCRSVLQTCLLLGWFPDIIHCNGWQTGLIPAYMRTLYAKEFAKTKILFTIHNIAEQGIFPAASVHKTGLDESAFESITHEKKLNCMKAGIVYADAITTVSPTYAQEIQKDKELTGGLSSLIKAKGIRGIINGIDLYTWNPKVDPFIAEQYDSTTIEKKAINKAALQERMNLPITDKQPLIGMISRLSEVKGIPLFLEAIQDVLKEGVQIVFLGDGDPKMKKELEKVISKNKKNIGLHLDFDEELAHGIEAGADMFLMPSKSEPCGLNQRYSMAYGTVPIVRATGGLVDTVNDFDPKTGTGNGIVFKKYTTGDLVEAVKRAVKLWKNTEQWSVLRQNAMDTDVSWAQSAKEYDEVYNNLFV